MTSLNATKPAEPATESAGPHYQQVWEWVEDWFVVHITRKINTTPGKGLAWDPQWWRYPEVVARFFALHAAWEEAVAAKSASLMSTWWTSHLEAHLRVILSSENGPMSGAGIGATFSGHPPLATLPAPPDVQEQHPQLIEALKDMDLLFDTVWDWVDGWFVKVVRRPINQMAGKGLSWDPEWWRYPEVVARFQSLHASWEHARANQSLSAMSTWWVSHLEPHLRIILDGDTGPMAGAGPGTGFTGHPALGAVPVEPTYQQVMRTPDRE